MKWSHSFQLSDALAAAALVVAGLGYLEAREANHFAQQRVEAQNVLVLRAREIEGDRLSIVTVNEDQVIQQIWFRMPVDLRSDEVRLNAEVPEFRLSWLESGIDEDLQDVREAGLVAVVVGQIPVGVTTTYVVEGRTEIDCSLYKIAYRASVPGNGPIAKDILGMALIDRNVACDLLDGEVERSWDSRISRAQ